MKPKNRVMCADCGRLKMLFETEKKALNFIKYNGEEITDNTERLRVYFCPSCGGYHITSKPYNKSYDYHTKGLIDAFKRQQRVARKHSEISNETIIQDIKEIAEKANIDLKNTMEKKRIKAIITDYFERHKGFPISRQEQIRHYFNEFFKK